MEEFRAKGAQLAEFEMELLFTKDKLLEMRAQQPGQREYIDRYLAIVATMQKRNEAMQENLRIQKNEFEQDMLMNSIEIDGVVEGMVEDTEDLAIILSQTFMFNFHENEIRGFETLAETCPMQELAAARPYILVVHLNNRITHDYLLHLAETAPVFLNGSPTHPLTIKQHLTFMNKQMLKKAEQEAKRLGLQKVWVSEGKIFVQRNCATHPYQIRCEKDIKKMPEY